MNTLLNLNNFTVKYDDLKMHLVNTIFTLYVIFSPETCFL